MFSRSVVTDVYDHLPFRLIYGQRKQLQGSVIIDGGSGYCKYGWSKSSRPAGRLSTYAAVLALYAARQTSGIVINVGFQVTSVVPILCGKVMQNVGVEIGVGALQLTACLSELMHEKGIDFVAMITVRTLKENLCYVAEDYHAELSKNVEASFTVGDEGVFTLSHERFQTGEILFQPELGGVQAMGLHRAVALCIEHCNTSEVGKVADEGWFKNVVLAGGSACLPGLAGRLEKELLQALPSTIAKGLKVLPPPYGSESAWFGAKIISNMSTFPEAWCITKNQFQKYGVNAIRGAAPDDN